MASQQDQSLKQSSLAPSEDSEARLRAQIREILRNLVRAINEKARHG